MSRNLSGAAQQQGSIRLYTGSEWVAVQLVREVANLAVEVAEVSETAKEWEEWKERESFQSPRRSRDDKMELGQF